MINKKVPTEDKQIEVKLIEGGDEKQVNTLKQKVRMLQEENEKIQNNIINDRKKYLKQLEE